MQPKNLVLIFLVFLSLQLNAQSSMTLYDKAMEYKKDHKIDEALRCFQLLLQSDSTQVSYLSNACIFYCKKGNRFSDQKTRELYFNTAFYLAKKALFYNALDAESHYSMAMSLGRLNEFAPNKTKILHAKEIKYHIDETLTINPAHGGAYHLLGRWHRAIAGFSPTEKILINNLYGTVPQGASYEAALDAFKKAIAFEPEYKLHQFELAQTYLEMGKPINAKVWYKHALTLKANNEDDLLIDEKCKIALLKLE